jgi:hypothetical protein
MTLMNQRQAAAYPQLSERERLLTQREAADYLGLSERTLERWRCAGKGPPYTKVERGVRYPETYLIQWAVAGLRQSTSEVVEARS